MKRIDQLKILSHDHHAGLVFARRMKQIAESGDADAIQAAWVEIKAYYEIDLKPHFEIEETLIAPALRELGETDKVDKMCAEHEKLQQFVTEACAQTAKDLHEFGVLLAQHIRFEERELFEVVQDKLPPFVLDKVALASAKMRPA